MSGLIYLEPRDNPEYFFRQLIHDINTNFSAATTGGGNPIQDGLNTYTGGTSSAQTINVSALTIDNIYVSGNSWFNTFSATTYLGLPTDVYVTGGTYSAGTATFINNTGGTFSVTGFSNSVNFTGTTNYYAKFNSGGTIQNGIMYDNGAAAVFVAPQSDNAGLIIASPAGFYYPALGFYNNGSNYLGGISAYANSLYISGAGAPTTPLIVSSVVQLPYLTGSSFAFINSFGTIVDGAVGTGLALSSGGTLSITGSTGSGGPSITAFTYDNSNKFTLSDSTGGTFNAIINIMTGLTVNGIISATTRVVVGLGVVNLVNPESLLVQDNMNTGSSYSNAIVAKADTNNYAQLNITNLNSGNMASSDIVATAANGNETVNFIDMGINSSAFTGSVGYANDAYVYSTGNDLLFGNASSGKAIKFFTDGTTSAQTRLTITSAQTFVNGVFTATTVSANTLYSATVSNLYGAINTSFTGTTSRAVESSSGGTLSATKEFIDSFLIPGSAPAVLLTATSGWTFLGIYTGTSITSTYQGQQYYDSNYYFVAVNDNDWIRMARV